MTDIIPKDEVLPGDYTYTARDGQPLKFPAGTKRSEIQGAIANYEGISPTDSAVAGFSRGTALGFGDEARAAIHAQFPEISKWMMRPPFDGKLTAGPVTNIITEGGPGMQGGETIYTPPAPPVQTLSGLITGATPQGATPVSNAPTYDRRYDENLATVRGEAKLHNLVNPNASMAGQIAGNVATSALMPGSWLNAKALLPWMLKSGATNALLGGVQGFGEGEGDFGNRLESAAWGAGIGGGVGAAVPVVGAFGKWAYKGVPTAMRGVANVLDSSAPRIANESVSSAAATPSIVQSGMRADVADWLRNSSDQMVRKATIARIADDLAASRITPEQAQAQLDRLGDASTLANLSPNVARSARDSYILPGEGREVIDANLNAQRQRLGGDLREAAGVPGAPLADDARAGFQKFHTEEGLRVYGQALDQTPLNMSPALESLANRPAVQEARAAAIADFAAQGIQPTEARLAHATKRYLNLIAEGKGDRAIDKSLWQKTANDYEQALWAANPHIQAADLRYAQVGGMERALDQGIDLSLGKGREGFNAQSLARDVPNMTIGENTGLRWGTQNAIRGATESEAQTRALVRGLRESDPVEGITARLAQVMPDRMDPLTREVNAQTIYGNTDRQIRGGAVDRAGDVITAAENLRGGGGGIPTDPRAVLTRTADWFLDKVARARNPTQLMRDEYARVATTMDRAQQEETLALVQQLLQGHRELTFMTPQGSRTVGGQEQVYKTPIAPGTSVEGLTIDIRKK